jgi:glycosyltransferase involved in cell wall biosynthesis
VRIALVHYHLRRGGVSTVIRHQAQALSEAGIEVLIIAGEKPPEDLEFPFALVEGLKYTALPEGEPDGEGLANAIIAAMEAHWGLAADVLHVHNPLIQKNALLIPALKILGLRGVRLFLQNHDLAEDFRPDVYAGRFEYPENCHYGVINSRDYLYLHRAGLKTEGLHLIPNEVVPLTAAPGLERTRYLYPVRAIRRKNIGEALLLSLFIPRGRTVALTLPPQDKNNPVYRRWVNLAAELGLPVEFALGETHSLEELLGSAVCVLTTSVKEGFGFSFLEPWTAGLSLIGRRIDYVCRDFEAAGVRFDALYNGIEIPADYVSLLMLKKKMESTVKQVYEAFALTVPSHISQMMADDLGSQKTFDFGRMDEELQESVIRTLYSNETVFQDVLAANPFLKSFAAWKPDENLIASNKNVIGENYGGNKILEMLLDIYRSVIDIPVTQKISKSLLLDMYLDPLRFSLVGVGNG